MNYVKLLRKDTGLEEAALAEIKPALMDMIVKAGETELVGPPVLRPGEVRWIINDYPPVSLYSLISQLLLDTEVRGPMSLNY